VDDGSTDATRAILASYGDSRMRLIANEENIGLTRSLNRGLLEARGRYVARQDADDVSAPERLALQVEHLDLHPDVALVASAYRRIDDCGRDSGDRSVPLDATAIRWRLLFLNAFAHSSVTLRRTVVASVDGYDETFRYAQDYELWSRIAERHEVAALPQRLLAYRRSTTSMTSLGDERDGAEIDRISRRNVGRIVPALGAQLDREAAGRLLFGSFEPVGMRRAMTTTRDVVTLQRAFVRQHELTRREALAHRASVVAALARGLRRTATEPSAPARRP